MKTAAISVLLAVSLLAAVPAQAAEKVLTFSVMRKGSEIGTHVITIKGDQQNAEVTMKTRINVRFLFVNAYTYTFDGKETWKDGKLVSLDENVNDDGAKHHITAEKKDGKLLLTVDNDSKLIDGDVIASSWWNKSTVKHDKLIDLITGQVQNVTVRRMGEDTVPVGNDETKADAYLVEGGIQRMLWYAKDGSFAHMTLTKKGEAVEYVRQ